MNRGSFFKSLAALVVAPFAIAAKPQSTYILPDNKKLNWESIVTLLDDVGKQKENAVKNQNFELASRYRKMEKSIINQFGIQELPPPRGYAIDIEKIREANITPDYIPNLYSYFDK